MKYFLIILICLYRKRIKPYYPKNCIFNESCSYYVERNARERGFFAGLKALTERYRSCRPGYHFIFTDNKEEWELVSKSGKHYHHSQIASNLISEAMQLRGMLDNKSKALSTRVLYMENKIYN